MTTPTPDGASASVRALVPPRAALWLGIALVGVLLVCSVIPVYVGGLAALVAFVLGAICGVNSAVSDVSRWWKALTGLLAGGAAGLGMLTADEPLLASVAVSVVGLIQAPLNARAASLAIFLPVLVAVFAFVDIPYSPAVLGAWVILGFLAIHWLAGLFRLPVIADPLPASAAWRHAAVFAISAGLILFLVMQWVVPNGYWLVMALASVLRPVPGETREIARQRIPGAVTGMMVAILIVWFLPQGVAVLLVLPCGALMIAWAVMKDLRKQFLFGTGAIVLITSAGAIGLGAELAMERIVAIALGAVIVGAAVVTLQFIESRTAIADHR